MKPTGMSPKASQHARMWQWRSSITSRTASSRYATFRSVCSPDPRKRTRCILADQIAFDAVACEEGKRLLQDFKLAQTGEFIEHHQDSVFVDGVGLPPRTRCGLQARPTG